MLKKFILKNIQRLKNLHEEINQTALEAYIASKRPQDTYDIERLTKEYNGKMIQGIY